ncbi:MAG TPA: hypothetical protein VMT26_06145 [Candidatus Bathyarchaeia archaeon]|jgi:hypothetical protein|nr:hypothetical protein [Candidatus Bathyarchaeia archaeon]
MQDKQAVRDLVLADTTSEQEVTLSTETIPSSEKIVERKTIIYETRVDVTVIKVAGDKLKDQLFARFGFLKPKPEEIELVSVDKYYEPYMIISGEYSIDYYRKCVHTVRLDKEVMEVILLGHEFEPKPPADSFDKTHNMIVLEGEERLVRDFKASLILDKSGRDVTTEKLPSAPSEKNPKKILAALGIKEIARDADLDIIRSKIVKRPTDINRLVSELFEVNERAVIYTPRFRVAYKNLRTGEEKAVEFDGVTADRVQQKKSAGSSLPFSRAEIIRKLS